MFYRNSSGDILDYTTAIKGIIDSSNITSAYVDLSNLLWLSTDNGLVKVKLQPQNFKKILHNENKSWDLSFRGIFSLKNGDIIAMCETENQLYKINAFGEAKRIPIPNAFERLKDARFFVSDTINNRAFTVTNFLIEIDFQHQRINSLR